MTFPNKVLSGVLVAQIALAVVTWMPSGDDGTTVTTLVDMDADAVTQITIVGRLAPDMDGPPDPLVLDRDGDRWVVGSLGGYPAKQETVDDVLEALAEVQVRAPIGTTPGAHAALNVADDQFTRKVTLTAGGDSATLFLGAGTGSSMQVRKDGTAEVYQLRGVTAWSIPDQARRFYDTDYVRVNLDEVSSFRVKNAQGDHTLIRMGGTWSSEELEDPSALSQDEANALARTLLTLRISEPASKGIKPEHGLDGSVRVEWSQIEEDATVDRGFTVGAQVDDTKRYVKADDSDWVVKVLESSVIRAIETDFKFLEGPMPEEIDNQPPGGFFGDAPPG